MWPPRVQVEGAGTSAGHATAICFSELEDGPWPTVSGIPPGQAIAGGSPFVCSRDTRRIAVMYSANEWSFRHHVATSCASRRGRDALVCVHATAICFSELEDGPWPTVSGIPPGQAIAGGRCRRGGREIRSRSFQGGRWVTRCRTEGAGKRHSSHPTTGAMDRKHEANQQACVFACTACHATATTCQSGGQHRCAGTGSVDCAIMSTREPRSVACPPPDGAWRLRTT
jgi:hypothetical protein